MTFLDKEGTPGRLQLLVAQRRSDASSHRWRTTKSGYNDTDWRGTEEGWEG